MITCGVISAGTGKGMLFKIKTGSNFTKNFNNSCYHVIQTNNNNGSIYKG